MTTERFRREAPALVTRRDITALMLLGAVTSPRVLAGTEEADAPFEVTDFDWVDTTRSRPVPARLYWPKTTNGAESAVPLVVFSHGIGGSRRGYSYLGRHWSSRGVASLHVQHVGSDAALWSGNPFGVVGRLQMAAQEREAIARAEDLSFALGRMLAAETGPQTGPLGARVDSHRIVAAGHSYGANTTLLAIGARVEREGRTIERTDPRFKAALVISAPPFYGERNLSAVLGPVAVPTMHVTSTGDVIEIPGYRSGLEDRLAVFDAIGGPRKMLAVFQRGSHSMFTDRSMTGGLWLNARVKAATADLALAFFDLVFNDDGMALAQWQTRWQAILHTGPAGLPLPMKESADGAT